MIVFITADSFVGEKYQQKHKALVGESGGQVVGNFQVQAMDSVDVEKVPRTKENIVEETLKLAPDIKKCIEGKN